MLSIREDYINIYYRGGNILRVKERNGSYSAFFDNEYNKSGLPSPDLPDAIESQDAARVWDDSFQDLKGIMDFYFSKHSKPEREFQQLVARENNFSTIANQSEYFISDIEFEHGGKSDKTAGIKFIKYVKSHMMKLPIILQSSDDGNLKNAEVYSNYL